MNVWLIGATVLIWALVPCALVCLRAPRLDAVVALECAGSLVTLVLMLLAEGFDRSSYFTLPLVAAALVCVNGLLFARFFGDQL